LTTRTVLVMLIARSPAGAVLWRVWSAPRHALGRLLARFSTPYASSSSSGELYGYSLGTSPGGVRDSSRLFEGLPAIGVDAGLQGGQTIQLLDANIMELGICCFPDEPSRPITPPLIRPARVRLERMKVGSRRWRIVNPASGFERLIYFPRSAAHGVWYLGRGPVKRSSDCG